MDITQISEQILQLTNELARLRRLIEADAAAFQTQLTIDHKLYQAEVARSRASHLDQVCLLSRRLKLFSSLLKFSNSESVQTRSLDSSSGICDDI